MSLFECRRMAFKNNQNVNPETGRKIAIGGEIHQYLVQKYLHQENISPKVSPNRPKLSPNKPKASPKKIKVYEIHNNGGRPFTVIIDGNKVNVHANKNINNTIVFNSIPILSYKADEIFIGKSPKNAMTINFGGYGPQFDGNSILIMVKNKYIYIGSTIYSFTSLAPIKKYISPVGNNDVPYPYAIDTQNNNYLMVEKIILLNYKGNQDPYDKYYKSEKKYPKFKGLEVKDWITDGYSTLFHNTVDSNANYDRLTKNGTVPMYIIDKKDKLHKLTKKDYAIWINDYNQQHQYKPLKYKTIIQR